MKNINQQFISYNKFLRVLKPIFIVIHDTGDPGATAQNEHDYFAGGNRGASADFFVDSNNIIQIIDTDNYYSWHCGDGKGKYGITNGNSLGIEMCLEPDGTITEDTVRNTLDLVKYLMDKYDIHLDKVIRHYDASRKSCPNTFSYNNWARWYDFKDKLCNSTISGQWILKDGEWWYEHDDGTYTKDGWEKINGAWYLFNSDGCMLYDWKMSEGNWYYLGCIKDGARKSGWLFLDNKWYYLGTSEDGTMKTGWQKIKDKWYYFDENGAMKTGWIKDNGKDYCLYSDGSMIHDCEMYGYRFAPDGVAAKLS